MALVLDLSKNPTFEVVSFKDESLKMTREEYDLYLENVVENQAMLSFKEGKSLDDCTKFVLKKNLKFEEQQKILAKQMSMKFDQNTKKTEMQSDLSYILEEVRLCITDINSPDQINALHFKRDSDGLLNRDICAALYSAGILMDLHTARQNIITPDSDIEKKS